MTELPNKLDQVEKRALTVPFESRIFFSSMTIFNSAHRFSKSVSVQRCIFGVSYHFSGRDSVTGIFPSKKRVNLDFQCPKLGITMMD